MKINPQINNFNAKMQKKIKNLTKAKKKSSLKLAKLMLVNSMRYAPVHTGNLVRGITYKKIPKGYRVESKVNTPFPYNLWVNAKPGIPVVTFGAAGGGKYYAPNQTVSYGGPAKSRGGNDIKWTGYPGFFSIAKKETAKQAKKIYVSQVKVALSI